MSSINRCKAAPARPFAFLRALFSRYFRGIVPVFGAYSVAVTRQVVVLLSRVQIPIGTHRKNLKDYLEKYHQVFSQALEA